MGIAFGRPARQQSVAGRQRFVSEGCKRSAEGRTAKLTARSVDRERKEPIMGACARKAVGLVLAASLAMGLAVVGEASVGATRVPFKATAVGRDTSESFGADGIDLTSLVHGNGTELGRFTQTLDYVISYDLVHFAGGGTITAADGSQVFSTFVGTEPGFAAQVFPTPFSGTLTIAGGTGRFDEESGQGTITGIDYGQGQFAFSIAGTLSHSTTPTRPAGFGFRNGRSGANPST
jgi:hypothetical protein